jgi:tRNA dimethylallyltransferase
VVVGGSGLYVKALSHGLADLPSDPAVRARLALQPLEEKLAELQTLDPATAASVNPTNPRHVDRALEICLLTGRPASEARSAWAGADPPGLRGVLLTWEREHLYERIDRRVEETFDGGAVDEVQALLASGREVSATAEKAIGFREIREFLTGRCPRSDAVAAMQQATRRYAKRQLTWFRRERWLKTVCLRPPDTPDSAAAVVIRDFLHD